VTGVQTCALPIFRWESEPLPSCVRKHLSGSGWQGACFTSDLRHETIALSGYVLDVTNTALAVTERFAQRAHVDSEIPGADDEAAPYSCHELLVADDLA